MSMLLHTTVPPHCTSLVSASSDGFGSGLGRVTRLAWSSDGKRLAVVHSWVIALWDVQQGQGIELLNPHPESLTQMPYSWRNSAPPSEVTDVFFFTPGCSLALRDEYGHWSVWNGDPNTPPRALELQEGTPSAPTALPPAQRYVPRPMLSTMDAEGTVLAIAHITQNSFRPSPDHELRVGLWGTRSGALQAELYMGDVLNGDRPTVMAFAPHSPTLAIGLASGDVLLWYWTPYSLN